VTDRSPIPRRSARHYGSDVLARNPHTPSRVRSVEHPADKGLVVEDPSSGFVGAVVRIESGRVELEDRNRRVRSFPLGPGFLVEGKPVILVKPKVVAATARTASGSVAVSGAKARVALASRIYVEGRHDAELVEQVWGADLRIEGVVVEYLGGVDDLSAIVAEFRPAPGRRLGVLVDHLVAGSKESKIADAVRRGPGASGATGKNSGGENTLVVGHPYIDIWQAVKPARLGLKQWPVIPRGTDWKHGICAELGWPHATQADIAGAWQSIGSNQTRSS